MYKRFVLAFLILFAPSAAHAIGTGITPPDFALQSLDQKSVRLSEYRGKVILLDFWASWCGPCRDSLPWMQSMQEKYGAQGFQVVAVNVDPNSEDARALLKELQVGVLTLLDPQGQIPELYELQSMPSSFLIGRDGKIALAHAGFTRSDREPLEHAIQSML